MRFRDRVSHAWNTFIDGPRTLIRQDNTVATISEPSYSYRSDRPRRFYSSERSIISSIYTRIAIDVADVLIQHVRLDDRGRFLEPIQSGFNRCLTIEANLDQSGRDFRQDMAISLLESGVIAIVPVLTSADPETTQSYDILEMRVGEVTEWFPSMVKVLVYNSKSGKREEILVSKKTVAIVENPLYSVMNEPNSTLQRLKRKLNILDAIDEQSGSGKLDLIIQLPYSLRNETKRAQAMQRRSELEEQLSGSKYGVGYIDAAEHVVQLNRAAENNLLEQIKYLEEMLYKQLGLTPKVFDGTADDVEMMNYNNRTVRPILSALIENMQRKFISKTAQTQGQAVRYIWDVFKLVPIEKIAEIADKLTRNAIASSNEIRTEVLHWAPNPDPDADALRNKNLPEEQAAVEDTKEDPQEIEVEVVKKKKPLALPSGNSAADGTTE